MIYIITVSDNQIFDHIFGAINIPHKIINLPAIINENKLTRKLAHVLWRIGVFIKWNLFGKDFNHILDSVTPDDVVIIYAFFPEHILNVVPRIRKCKSVYVWLWDSMSSITDIKRMWPIIKKVGVPIITFDHNDAKVDGLSFHPSMYNVVKPFELDGSLSSISFCDCYYIGNIKDNYRNKCIERFTSVCKMYGLTYCFNVVGKGGKYISYYENLHNLTRCKAIVEINIKGQSGISLRSMEALVYKKKLITNNKAIREYDFYNPHNIFIIGEDDESGLKDFVNSDYEDVQESILMRYDVNSWLDNIINQRYVTYK